MRRERRLTSKKEYNQYIDNRYLPVDQGVIYSRTRTIAEDIGAFDGARANAEGIDALSRQPPLDHSAVFIEVPPLFLRVIKSINIYSKI